LHHPFSDFPAQNELRVEVDFNQFIPVFVRVFDGRLAQDGPGIVHQDIDGWEIGLHLFDERIKSLAVAEIAGITTEVSAQRPNLSFHLAAGFLLRGADSDNVGSGLCQSQGHGLSDSAPRARRQGDFAFEFELVKNMQFALLPPNWHLSSSRAAKEKCAASYGLAGAGRLCKSSRRPAHPPLS